MVRDITIFYLMLGKQSIRIIVKKANIYFNSLYKKKSRYLKKKGKLFVIKILGIQLLYGKCEENFHFCVPKVSTNSSTVSSLTCHIF